MVSLDSLELAEAAVYRRVWAVGEGCRGRQFALASSWDLLLHLSVGLGGHLALHGDGDDLPSVFERQPAGVRDDVRTGDLQGLAVGQQVLALAGADRHDVLLVSEDEGPAEEGGLEGLTGEVAAAVILRLLRVSLVTCRDVSEFPHSNPSSHNYGIQPEMNEAKFMLLLRQFPVGRQH